MSDALRFTASLRRRVGHHLRDFERRALPRAGRRAAAVAALLVAAEEGDAACFIITRRAAGMRDHAGQWALPGGRLDAGETPEQAALREIREEIGLALDEGCILGRLDDYATRSGFVITPVVVWAEESDALELDPSEVAALYRVALAELERPDVPILRPIPESDRPVVSVPLLGTTIHAPTAAVLYQLREVALHGRATRVADFDQPVFAWR